MKELRSAAMVEDGSLHQVLGPEAGFEIRSDADGQSYITGYVATKDGYRINGKNFDEEVMTEEALRSIADQINNANKELRNAEVAFPDPQVVDKTTGNLEHQNSPISEKLIPMMADTRTVPALRFVKAEYDGYGVEVRADIRENALPKDTVDAIKQNIKEGVLGAFSIEFRNARSKYKRVGGRIRRVISDLDFAGAGLTSGPKNPNTILTGAQLRSVLAEEDEAEDIAELKEEIRAEVIEDLEEEIRSEHWTSKAGVRYQGTKDGELDESAIDKEETDLGDHYLFGSGENKEDYSYPVVDAEGYLRRGNVEAAHSLGARGEVDASELERKLKSLNDEFDTPPITFKDEDRNSLNDNMGEDEPTDQGEGQPEDGEGDNPEDQGENRSELKETVEEMRSTVDEIKKSNEELREENEELRSQLEDYQEIEELKSDIDSIEEELRSLADEGRPVTDPEEQRNEFEENEDDVPAELRSVSSDFIQENRSVLAEKYNMTEEEVLEHA